MKSLITLIILTLSFSSFADYKLKAQEVIDRGDYSEVHNPYIWGCLKGHCYGGPMYSWLKPNYSANKICKKLGFSKKVKNSKVSMFKKVGIRYSLINFYVFYRNGTPGAPEPTRQKVITYLECHK